MKIRRLFKQLKQERLTPNERKTMLEAIVRAQQEFPACTTKTSSVFVWWRLSVYGRTAMVAISILLIFGISGGSVLAAESALPGDILYPVKINVNERARIAIAITPENKATVAERLAERRVEELEKIVEQDRLNSENESEILTRFSVQKALMEKYIARLEEKGNADRAQALRTRLSGFIEMKEEKIIATLEIQLKEEIINTREKNEKERNEKPSQSATVRERLKEKEDDQKRKQEETNKKIERGTAAMMRANIKNELKIKLERQREERKIESEKIIKLRLNEKLKQEVDPLVEEENRQKQQEDEDRKERESKDQSSKQTRENPDSQKSESENRESDDNIKEDPPIIIPSIRLDNTQPTVILNRRSR